MQLSQLPFFYLLAVSFLKSEEGWVELHSAENQFNVKLESLLIS